MCSSLSVLARRPYLSLVCSLAGLSISLLSLATLPASLILRGVPLSLALSWVRALLLLRIRISADLAAKLSLAVCFLLLVTKGGPEALAQLLLVCLADQTRWVLRVQESQ